MIKRKQFLQFLAPYCVSFEKSVGAIVFHIVDGKIEFLLIKYRNGHWEFPRGHAEDGETEYETMKREIKEETNISNLRIIEGFRETMSFFYKAQGQELLERKRDRNCIFVHKKVVFYLAETVEDNVIISHEHQRFQWLSFEEGHDKLTFKNAQDILSVAYENLKNINN